MKAMTMLFAGLAGIAGAAGAASAESVQDQPQPQPQPQAQTQADATGMNSLPWRNMRHFREAKKWLVEPRIVGGAYARQGDDPWQVALVEAADSRNLPVCGGTLIAPAVVVTAGHCVDEGVVATQIAVVAGTVNLDRPGDRVLVRRIVVYGNVFSVGMEGDIALLFLERAPTLSRAITPATPAVERIAAPPARLARVTGWGETSEGGELVRELRTVEVPIVSNSDCNDEVSHSGRITANMICAGYETNVGKDACSGDSGGPLTVPTGATRALIGVVSWAPGGRCAVPNLYGVYVRVASYEPWIQRCAAGGNCLP